MTAPVSTDDVVQGLVKHLLACPELVEVVGHFDNDTPWIFQDSLLVRMESTSGQTAAVVSYAGGWGPAEDTGSVRRPRLALELWADPIRDAAHNAVTPSETRLRLFVVFEAFDRQIRLARGGQTCWGSVRVTSCTRLGEPTIYPVPDGDGLLRGQALYAVSVF